ncbi:MAG: hypothetical protein ACR2IM_01275 [Sediminibacterium sp.]
MKLELVKETKPNGSILYSIQKDGLYVSNTATSDLQQAETFFNNIVNGSATETTVEIIKTIEN